MGFSNKLRKLSSWTQSSEKTGFFFRILNKRGSYNLFTSLYRLILHTYKYLFDGKNTSFEISSGAISVKMIEFIQFSFSSSLLPRSQSDKLRSSKLLKYFKRRTNWCKIISMPLFSDNGNRDFSFSKMKFTLCIISVKSTKFFNNESSLLIYVDCKSVIRKFLDKSKLYISLCVILPIFRHWLLVI